MSLRLVPPRVGKTPFWYVRGTFAGRTINASSKARDKAAARRFKDELESKLADAANRKRRPVTFREAAQLYLEFRRPQRRDENAIRRLVAVIGDKMLPDIRQHILIEAANALYPKCTPETKNRQALTLAAAILHYAAENDLCPLIRVRKLKEKQPEARAVTKDQAAVLIEAAEGKLRLLLIFLFCQGWRISDALRLAWQDIDLEHAVVRYRVAKIDEWRSMPLHLRVTDALIAVTSDERVGRVFPWRTKYGVYKRLRAVSKSVGFRFTPHMARHSFATWLVNEGVTIADLMEAGGWRDHKSVLRYARVDQNRVRATINKIKS